MARFVKHSLLLAVLNVTCWAQVSLTLAEQPQGGVTTRGTRSCQAISTYNGIQYNGGPVMNDPQGTNVYFIWYGNWSNNTEPAILTDFINNLGGTAYFNINSSYYDFNKFGGGEKDPVVNRINFGGSVTDNYSLGNNLTDNNVAQIVGSHITSGFGGGDGHMFPVDPSGVFFVLASKDVTEGSFCSQFCGWHSFGFAGNVPIKVAFIGDPVQCPSTCLIQNPSPNNNPSGDTTASYIAHELSESVTDPKLNAWVNPGVCEMGDLCEDTYGNIRLLPNGSSYNLSLARGRISCKNSGPMLVADTVPCLWTSKSQFRLHF